MNPVVLYGCAAWDQARLPRDEFEERIRLLRERMAAAGLYGLILYGDSCRYAKLCYVTNYIPKLGWAVAWIPSSGDPVLLAGVLGTRELAEVRMMTWLEDVRMAAAADLGVKLGELAAAPAPGESSGDVRVSVGLCGSESMKRSLLESVLSGFPGGVTEADGLMDGLMRRKRPRELAVIRRACAILSSAMASLKGEYKRGGGALDAAAEAERTARALGAHDVRVMFSLDGGRTMQPYENESAASVRPGPFAVYLAVEYLGYWAEGMLTIGGENRAVNRRAAELLRRLSEDLRPGTKIGELVGEIEKAAEPFRMHPVLEGSWGCGIGLGLGETPALNPQSGRRAESGDIYTLRVGLSDVERNEHVLVSRMIRVGDGGNETLWEGRP